MMGYSFQAVQWPPPALGVLDITQVLYGGISGDDLTDRFLLPNTDLMTDLSPWNDVEQVCAGLGKAWGFLCGEERAFALTANHNTELVFTEFSYFMPLKVSAEQRTGGMGVLIQRPDARDVAAHMFGADASLLQEADLHDACAEVCNLFSDCVALHMSGNSDVTLDLPFLASQADYDQIAAQSTVTAVYVSSSRSAQLFVVEYHIFSQPH